MILYKSFFVGLIGYLQIARIHFVWFSKQGGCIMGSKIVKESIDSAHTVSGLGVFVIWATNVFHMLDKNHLL